MAMPQIWNFDSGLRRLTCFSKWPLKECSKRLIQNAVGILPIRQRPIALARPIQELPAHATERPMMLMMVAKSHDAPILPQLVPKNVQTTTCRIEMRTPFCHCPCVSLLGVQN